MTRYLPVSGKFLTAKADKGMLQRKVECFSHKMTVLGSVRADMNVTVCNCPFLCEKWEEKAYD